MTQLEMKTILWTTCRGGSKGGGGGGVKQYSGRVREGYPSRSARRSGGALQALPVGSGAEPQPATHFMRKTLHKTA